MYWLFRFKAHDNTVHEIHIDIHNFNNKSSIYYKSEKLCLFLFSETLQIC